MTTLIRTLLMLWSVGILLWHSELRAQNITRTDYIYLICRGTRQKVGLIAEKYNLKDSKSTHVGIGFVQGKNLIIYHVTNDSDGPSDLVIQSLSGFKNPNDLFYLSIWMCPSSAKEISRLKKILQSYSKQKIVFDTDFKAHNQKLYCSEFCAEVLEKLNPKKFKFSMKRQTLDFFSAKILGCDVLEYYPVDFFQSSVYFKKIFEQIKS